MRNTNEYLKAGRHIKTKTNRQPVASMNHSEGSHCTGSVLLARGASSPERSVVSAGTDGIIKEWEIATGKYLGKQYAGHYNAISCITSFTDNNGLLSKNKGESQGQESDTSKISGIISCSWDGTIRLRRVR